MTIGAHADQQFGWLLGNFVQQTDGVREAVAVSSDGLLIASSDGLDRTDADHLAAIVSSLASLGRSASRRYDFEGLKLIMIEMKRGFLLVSVDRRRQLPRRGRRGRLRPRPDRLRDRLSGRAVRAAAHPALISESRRQLPQ